MSFYEQLVALENEGTAFVLVTLVEAIGSTPQDAGAKILVTAAGLHAGTVGGGRVEAKAVELGTALLAESSPSPRLVAWTLKGDVGMTCGGSVKFYLEPHGGTALWNIVVFGAGHVAQALIPALLPLPCRVTCIDSRQDWLAKLPEAANLKRVLAAEPHASLPGVPDGSFLVVMTQGHTTDRPILKRALTERSFPFIGVIGSDSKAEILRRELAAEGVPAELSARFHCPIGLRFGSNHPHEIALSIAAQLVAERDRLAAGR